jgi:hypothetical protein
MLAKAAPKVAVVIGLMLTSLVGVPLAARAASPSKQTVSADASAAIAQMGRSLLAGQFSLRARTLRVYADKNGDLLHIAHAMKISVRRPDKLRIDIIGDDGSAKLIYDGRRLVLFGVDTKRYAISLVPNTIQGMLELEMGRFDVDLPLADFLADDPSKAFLLGVTSGREVNTVTIDGTPCRHLLFERTPGFELELWVEKNDRALPRRLIVTYHNLPGRPSFVAELFDWDFSVHPSDADFAFQPPEGAVQIELKPAAATPTNPQGDTQ